MHRQVNSVNIHHFRNNLINEELEEIYEIKDEEQAYECFIRKVFSYFNHDIPLTKSKLTQKGINKPWITNGLMTFIEK